MNLNTTTPAITRSLGNANALEALGAVLAPTTGYQKVVGILGTVFAETTTDTQVSYYIGVSRTFTEVWPQGSRLVMVEDPKGERYVYLTTERRALQVTKISRVTI